MDFNATIDIIIKDLNEAREIIDDLKKYPGVPELQVELAKSKCKSASEVIALLKNIPVKDCSGKRRKSHHEGGNTQGKTSWINLIMLFLLPKQSLKKPLNHKYSGGSDQLQRKNRSCQ